MATNGNNGNIGFTDNPQVGSGLGGYALGKMAKQNFTREYWGIDGNDGYLTNTIKSLEQVKQFYKEIATINSDMTKAEKTALNKKKAALDMQLKAYKDLRDLGDVTDTEALESIKEGNKLRLKGIKDYVNALDKAIKKEEEATGKISESSKKSYEDAVKMYNQTKKQVDDTDRKVKQYGKIISQASTSFSDSLSKTLKSAGDRLSGLSNMFNLQSIANNTTEQNAKEKSAIIGEMSRLYNFNNNSQFESFKNSLNDTITQMNNDMGYIFNSSDMKQYMSNLSTWGVTSSKMAQDQMKSSILSTKYLGTSSETMEAMFKYMKRTNNNDIINEHNKTIVGIMKAQLGVSKEQLDALSQKAYTGADALAALGADEKIQNKYIQESTIATSALSSINSSWGSALGDIFNDMIATSADEYYSKYGKIFGNDAGTIRSQLYSGNAIDALKTMMSSSYLSNMLSSNNIDKQGMINKVLGIDNVNSLATMSNYFNGSSDNQQKLLDALNKTSDEISNTNDTDVDNYIESTTQTTIASKLLNLVDGFFNKLDWKYTIGLANAAFTMYLASGAINATKGLINFMGGFNSGGGLKGGLNALFGKGANSATGEIANQMSLFNSGGGTAGKALSTLSTGITVAGLTAAVIGTLSSISKGAQYGTGQRSYEETMNDLEGTNYANNTSIASAHAIQESTKSQTGLGRALQNTTSGLWYGATKAFTKDRYTLNKNLANWMYQAGLFDNENYAMTFAFMLDSIGDLGALNTATGQHFTHDTLKQAIKSGLYTKTAIDKLAADIISGGWKLYTDSNGGRMTSFSLNVDGYHLAGKDYIPKDNYRALLHKGEMVLNAKDANIYRQMINGNIALLPSNSNRGIGGQLAGVELGDFNSSYTNGHSGVDLYFGTIGTPVGSAVAGKVIESKDIPANYKDGKSYHGKDSNGTAYSSYGRVVKVKGNNGETYIYAHLNERVANVGDIVQPGTLLGYSGTTGNSSGPHLHFEVQGKGNNSAAHAKFYTPYVRNVIGAPNSSSKSVPTDSTDASSTNMPIATKRFVPKAFQNSTGGIGGAVESITNSVNSGFDRLISYLDNIREEQSAQRAIINAFAKTRASESSF